MHKNVAASLFIALTLFGLSAGVSNTAQADFGVSIDCANIWPEWGGSTDDIPVHALINGSWVYVTTFRKEVPGCVQPWSGSQYLFQQWSWTDVQALRLTNNGTDTFWVDRVSLLDGWGNRVAVWGDDDYLGYCLSRNAPGGGNSAYCIDVQGYRRVNYNR